MEIAADLLEALQKRRVIPFVGAGVSRAVRDRETRQPLFPNWWELLKQAADQLDRLGKGKKANLVRALIDDEPPGYLEAANTAREALGPSWYPFLRRALDPPRERAETESLKLARLVWELGSKLVVTTNADRVLWWTCPDHDESDYWDIEAPAEQLELLSTGQSPPTIWYLHGRIRNKQRFIMTPDGYSRLYSTEDAEQSYPAARATLRTLLATRSFLFIGYSLDDADLVRELISASDTFADATGPHFVVTARSQASRFEHKGLPVRIIEVEDFGPPLEACLDALRSTAASAPDAAGPDRYSPSRSVFYVPFRARREQAIGREPVVEAVHRQLFNGNKTGYGRTAALQGIGGLGKTQVAVEYAYQHREKYANGVIWLSADRQIEPQLALLSDHAGWIAPTSEQKHKVEIAQRRIRHFSDTLLIFDNVEKKDSIVPYLPEIGTDSHVLITSRGDQPGFIPVALDPLDDQLSARLLFQEAGREPAGREERAAAQEIIGALNGLPLAIELAGSYLRHRGDIGWVHYRDLLRSKLATALSGRYLSSFTRHEADLYSTLKVSDEALSEEPWLKEILDLLTWSGPSAIGRSLLCTALGIDDPEELTGALGLGTALRLLRRVPGEDRYALHRLVMKVRQVDLPLGERGEWVDVTCTRVATWFEQRREEIGSLHEYVAEVDHLVAWKTAARQYAPRHDARLTWLLGYPPFYLGRYGAARDHFQSALDLVGGPADEVLRGNVLNDLGQALMALGRYDDALRHFEDALRIRRERSGSESWDTITTLGNVAVAHGYLGEHEPALRIGEEALAAARRLGSAHPETARMYNDVGLLYGSTGDLGRELENAKRALHIWRSLYGDRHPYTAKGYNNLGSMFGQQGDHVLALRFLFKALRIWARIFGKKHPDCATAYSNIASEFGSAGDHDRELRYLRRTLQIRRALFGDGHPDTATACEKLGVAYRQVNDELRALRYGRKALSIRRRRLGDLHPDTATSYSNVGLAYQSIGRFDRAQQYLEYAVGLRQELFGWENRLTTLSASHLVHNLVRLGQRGHAAELLDRFLRELPGDHPDVEALRQLRAGLLV